MRLPVASADLSTVAVEPTFHVAPVLLEDPSDIDALTDAMHVVAREARTIEARLAKEEWIVGAAYSATDMVIFPWLQLLRRALDRSAATELGARFLPMEKNYPALVRWIRRIEALPGYERTYPPHWRET